MLTAAQAMADHRVQLWQRGVPDEAVVILPCRIAYPMLEQATGVMARKAVCGDQAIKMIAVSLQQTEQLLSTVTAALMDLMHSFEHMAAITAELCTMVSEEPVNRLAVELIREIGRLDAGAVDAKATGIKNVAPFVTELAVVRPKLVLVNLSHLLPHLQQEPYNMRSAIVTAVQHILEWLTEQLKEPAHDAAVMEQWTKQRTVLLDLLTERVYDVSSYTRSTVMKAWLRLASQRAIPKDRCLAVTRLVADRLQDKTVLVRKQAMQVRHHSRRSRNSPRLRNF
jgi:condensin complex subunit 1